jgi:exopolyphosphatase/guanosine-5'-triphosphate,3'-diphosphate pyrophosphatase
VVGTAALRDAVDGADFIARVRDEIGLTIRVISGDEEANYAARGVLMYDPNADGVVADFGGGSLEFARIHHNDIHDTISLPLGAYRVQSMGNKARDSIVGFLAPLKPRFGSLDAFYAIGGSWRVLASAYMKDKRQPESLQGYRIAAPEMIAFCQHIKGQNEMDLRRIYRMEQHHARLAGIAAFTLEIVLQELAPKEFVVSMAGVRDGVVHEFLSTSGKNG